MENFLSASQARRETEIAFEKKQRNLLRKVNEEISVAAGSGFCSCTIIIEDEKNLEFLTKFLVELGYKIVCCPMRNTSGITTRTRVLISW